MQTFATADRTLMHLLQAKGNDRNGVDLWLPRQTALT